MVFDTTALMPFVREDTLEDLRMEKWSVAVALSGLSTRCVVLCTSRFWKIIYEA